MSGRPERVSRSIPNQIHPRREEKFGQKWWCRDSMQEAKARVSDQRVLSIASSSVVPW